MPTERKAIPHGSHTSPREARSAPQGLAHWITQVCRDGWFMLVPADTKCTQKCKDGSGRRADQRAARPTWSATVRPPTTARDACQAIDAAALRHVERGPIKGPRVAR